MTLGAGRRVVEAHHARRAVGSLPDAEDAAVAALAESVLVEHLDLDRQALHGLDGRVGEVGGSEPLGGGRHEVLHQATAPETAATAAMSASDGASVPVTVTWVARGLADFFL